jgi:hypothetical protein
MNDEMLFFLFLIERYAEKHDRSTGDVLREWDERGVTQEIYDGYFQYHQERLENAFEDIDALVATGKRLVYGEE